MKVVANNVAVIKKAPETKKSSGGIIVSTQEDFRTPISSEVVAIGPDVKTVQVGDTVYYLPKSGDTLKLDGETYIVLPETQIVAIV